MNDTDRGEPKYVEFASLCTINPIWFSLVSELTIRGDRLPSEGKRSPFSRKSSDNLEVRSGKAILFEAWSGPEGYRMVRLPDLTFWRRNYFFIISLFHNSNIFGSCIIHILYTGCAKIKKNNSGVKRLRT